MFARKRVLAIEFLFTIILINITSANRNLEEATTGYFYGEDSYENDETSSELSLSCQVNNACEAFCVQQNKSSSVERNILNDTRCSSTGYHLHFIFSKLTTLGPGWFVNNALIRKVTIRDNGDIVKIQPGTFDDCTFRLVWSLEIRATAITTLKRGALAGLNNLKILSLHGNNALKEIEEDALEGLFQLEEFVMEEQKLLSDLGNVTEKIDWKYLHSLTLTKNCFGSIIKKPTFKGCTRVKKLDLSYSEIEAIGPHSFEPMEATLEILDLRNNRLKNIPSGLLQNLIRPNVQFYLSKNLWDCGCNSLELQGYLINNSDLFAGSPLICESPLSEKENPMKDALIECFDTTTAPYIPSTSTTTTESPENLDHLSCFDQNVSHQSGISVETEYQFFNIIQEAPGKVSIEMNIPDASLALVLINDHDYKGRCQYNLKRRMEFDSLNTNAGYLFCLIKKSSHSTSPRNCLPFHFTETKFVWGRDKIVITLVCSFALATILGIIIGWVLVRRYRRAFKSVEVSRNGSRNSRSKMINDDFNSWSAYHRAKYFMDSNNSSNLRRSYSETSLASYKTYMTPSPIFEVQRRNRNTIGHSNDYNIGHSNDYNIGDYFDKLPYDIIPPPLPPCNGRRERIYETIIDPPFTCASEIVPYVYLQRKY